MNKSQYDRLQRLEKKRTREERKVKEFNERNGELVDALEELQRKVKRS